jgi:hypothetical protein
MQPFVVRLRGVLGMPRSDRGVITRGPARVVSLSLCYQRACAFGVYHLVCHVEIGGICRLMYGEFLALALATVTSGEDAGSCWSGFALYVGRCRPTGVWDVLVVAIIVNWEARAERC